MSKCRAAQVAIVPESDERIASWLASRSTTRMRYCGWIGSRSPSSSAAMSLRHLPIACWAFSRNPRSVLRRSSRHAVARADRVDVDLHRADLVGAGQVLGVGEVSADHEQRLGALHDLLAGPGAEQPDAPGGQRV